MATIKSYTDIPQSKKLAKILPLESADMWHHGFFTPSRMHKIEYNPPAPYHSVTPQWDCPCWSLAALLGVLPSATLDTSDDHYCRLRCQQRCTEWYDNPIDACYEMILKLKENNLL